MNSLLPSDLTLIPLSRQAQLRGWLAEKGLSWAFLGRRMGISAKAVALLCRNEAIAPHRWAQLRDLGLPAALLPEARNIKPGPKPRS